MDPLAVANIVEFLSSKKIIIPIISGIIVVYLSLWLRNCVIREFAYRKIRSNKRMALGRWVRIPTSTGYVDGRIKAIERSGISIEILDGDKFVGIFDISILDAEASRWFYLSREALGDSKDAK